MSLQEILQTWQLPLRAVNCGYCDWTYLLEQEAQLSRCPHCYQQDLSALTDEDLPQVYPPEQLLPFNVSNEQVQIKLKGFSAVTLLAAP